MHKLVFSALLIFISTFDLPAQIDTTKSMLNAKQSSQIKLSSDKTQSVISYSMHHPLKSFSAVSKEVTSVILTDKNRNDINQVEVLVKINSFDSKNPKRDFRIVECTEAMKFPNVSFTSNSIRLENNRLMVRGTLNFHGVDQMITFEITKKTIDSKTEVTGNFNVQMTQFKIKPPSLMGIPADDDIKMSFKLLF